MVTSTGRPAAAIALVLLPLAFIPPGAAARDESVDFCRSVDGSTSSWLDSTLQGQSVSQASSIDRFVEIVRHHHMIPLSFIDQEEGGGWGGESIQPPVGGSTLDHVLRSIGDQHPDYVCEVRSGRVILRTRDSVFDTVISGVDIANTGRTKATLAYLDYLRSFNEKFANWSDGIYVTGEAPWPPEDEEKVTLTPRATLADHLIQLLGRDRRQFFTVPYSHPEAPRTIYTGHVAR